MTDRKERGALELLLPGHYFDDMMETQEKIRQGRTRTKEGRKIFEDLKIKRLGPPVSVKDLD